MGLRSFRSKLILRILLLALNVFFATVLFLVYKMWPVSLALGFVLFLQSAEFLYFVNNTNRKLTLFLDSVKYSDFVTNFSADNSLGSSFKNLNTSFNSVLRAFKDARLSTEENLQYLHMVVEHVDTGVITFDEDGKVEVVNGIASQLLGVRKIRDMNELKDVDGKLNDAIWHLTPGKRALYQVSDDIHLSIRATQFTKRGKFVKLVALQNIQRELNTKELESWQNLLHVLRHEIMNSMTPISSLAETLKVIFKEDLKKNGGGYELTDEIFHDIKDSLGTIESRSKGLITFLKGYQEYTSLPTPDLRLNSVHELITGVEKLMRSEIEKRQIDLSIDYGKKDFELLIDSEQMGHVLINLVKNAVEALNGDADKKISIRVFQQFQYKIIEVEDNGPGIIPEAIDKIFIPFYTTKKSGSGIGLSLSRQFVQMNNGSLHVASTPDVKTTFRMVF